MKDAEGNRRYDRAWGVLLGASLCMFCGIPSVIYYTFGIFIPQIIAETQWPAPAVAAAIGPATLIAACLGPVIGRLSDRVGVRPLALIGGPAFGIGIALLGWASASPGGFTLLTILMFVLAFAGSPIPYAQALTGWFDRRRGLALGMMFCAGAIGIAVWPVYATALIDQVGWRQAYMAMGATAGGVIFLAGIFLLRNAPSAPTAMANPQAQAPGLAVGEALRTQRFWKTALIFLLMSAVLGGMAVQFPVVLRREGTDAQTAAMIMSVIGIFMFLGRLLLGFILDRWFAPHVTIAIAALSILPFILLLTMGGTLAALTVAAALLGFGLGTEYAVAAYMTSRAFGFRSFGAIYGLITLATGIGLGIGPATIGVALVTDVPAMLIYGAPILTLLASIGLLLTLGRDDLPYGQRA